MPHNTEPISCSNWTHRLLGRLVRSRPVLGCGTTSELDGCTRVGASFCAHWLISRGFTLNWSGIEFIESFDDVMKDAIKNVPVGVMLNGSASSNALA